MANKIKLTPPQKFAIKLMREGYELGESSGYSPSVWLQLGGCGRGGKSEKISFGTFWAIEKRKLVEPFPNQGTFPRPTRFRLTELGKSIDL